MTNSTPAQCVLLDMNNTLFAVSKQIVPADPTAAGCAVTHSSVGVWNVDPSLQIRRLPVVSS